jgi:hypothetical protein
MYSKRTWWPVLSASVFALIAIAFSSVRAQNLPPPGAYQPIPNFTGVGAGLQFREAINSRFSGMAPMLPMLVGPSFANLPAEQDGLLVYCQDCKRTTPCGNGGAGAFALGTRGQWSCSTAALEASLNANGNKITSLANGTVTGDALAFGQTSGGDLAGSLPNPTVATVLGGQAPIYSGQTGALINTLAGARGDGSDALVNFNVNGVLNVRAYGAKGDGVTNDWAAIQNTIYAACGATPPAQPSNVSHGVVYLPPTPNNTAYLISRPLQITCGNITVMGASDRNTTHIQANYEGPTFIVEGFGENNFPILAKDPAWASSTAYPQNAEIKDSNGNIEVATTPGTSGTAAHPMWATSQGSTTADGSVTWTLEVIGTQLATGTGSAASLQATAIQSNVELLNLGDDPQLFSNTMNPLGAITVEGYFLAPTYYGAQNIFLLGTSQAYPGTLSGFYTPDSLYIEACGTCSTQGQLKAQLKLSGGTVTITGNTTNLFTPNTTHHVALSYNGSTVYLFLDGALVGSSAGSGTLVWPAFETWSYAGGAFTPTTFWPDQDGSPEFNTYGAFGDSIRVSNVARYTSSFTKPTAKFASDANTLLLLNFPTNAPDETQVGVWGSSSAPIYFAVRGNNASAQTPSVTLENLEVCPTGSDGIFATWAPASLYDHIRCSAAAAYGINWYENDFESRANDIFIQGGLGTVGFESGGADNDSDVNNVQVTGATVGFLEAAGNVRWGTPIYAEPGNDASYPFVCAEGWGTLIQPFTDIEGSDTNALGDMWLFGCRWTIIGGEFDLQNNVPNITMHSNNSAQDFMPTFINSEFSNTVGTNPVFFFDSSFGGQSVSGPVEVEGAATYINEVSGTPLTNSPAFVITPDSCNGQVTLASGSGTFSNICVTTASSCTAVDTTMRSNSVTLGTPTNGSVSLTGTGSDVIKMGCR